MDARGLAATSPVGNANQGAADALVAQQAALGHPVRAFQADVREVLCPSLKPGDVVIMDNLGPHKNAQTLALIRAANASVLFLPAYSPDLNPIEMMWSKVKAFLRKAEARSHPDLINAITQALHAITPQDAANWFAHCGYRFI